MQEAGIVAKSHRKFRVTTTDSIMITRLLPTL